MSKAIDVLKSLGAEAISHQTHIPKSSIDALLHERFEQFSPIQFNGFMTIIEREYDLDLSEYRSKFHQANNQPQIATPPIDDENDPLTNSAKQKRHKQRVMAIVTTLLVLVLALAAYLLGNSNAEEKIELNNTAIEAARHNIEQMRSTSSSKTVALVDAVQKQRAEEASSSSATMPIVYDDVVIVPRRKIWLGIIDAETGKRYVKITPHPYSLDGNRSWLIITGHGLMTLECAGVKAAFNGRDRLLFLYESGKCSKIDEAEFKARNRGRVW